MKNSWCIILLYLLGVPVLVFTNTVSRNGRTYNVELSLDSAFYTAKSESGVISRCLACTGDSYLEDICPGGENRTSTCRPCAPGFYQPARGFHIKTHCVRIEAVSSVIRVILRGIRYNLKWLPWPGYYTVKVNGARRACRACPANTFLYDICEEPEGLSVCTICPPGTHQPAMSHLNTSCEESPERKGTVNPSVTPAYKPVAMNLTCEECPDGYWKMCCTKDRDNNTVAMCCYSHKETPNMMCELIGSPQEFDSNTSSVNIATTVAPGDPSTKIPKPDDEGHTTKKEHDGPKTEDSSPTVLVSVFAITLVLLIISPVLVYLVLKYLPYAQSRNPYNMLQKND